MRIFAYLLPVRWLLAVLQFAIAERVLPQAENTLKAWWSASAPAGEASTPALGQHRSRPGLDRQRQPRRHATCAACACTCATPPA